MIVMTDKESSKVYDQLDKYISTVKRYFDNIKAEPDHGPGFETPELRKGFIDYVEKFNAESLVEFNKLKSILENIQ
jgi:hypothetical protein